MLHLGKSVFITVTMLLGVYILSFAPLPIRAVQDITPTAVGTLVPDTLSLGKSFLLMDNTIIEVDANSLQKILLTIQLSGPEFQIRDIKIDGTSQFAYMIEGTSSPQIALGESNVFQVDLSTGIKTIMCKRRGLTNIALAENGKYALALGYSHPRATLVGLLSVIDVQQRDCRSPFDENSDNYSILPSFNPQWLDSQSFLGILPVAQLMLVNVQSLTVKQVFAEWWIADFEPIPGTHDVLVAGAPKTEDAFSYQTKFAEINLDSFELKIWPYRVIDDYDTPHVPHQPGSLFVSSDGEYFAHCIGSPSWLSLCHVYERETGKVTVTVENATDLDWSKDGRYLIVTTNDRFIQYDVITGKSVDLGAANGAVLLKVDY